MAASALALTIANQIAELIASGELTQNAHLSTQNLADKLGVSRSPVREAMQLLMDRGLLERKSNRGFFVAAGDLSESTALVSDETSLQGPDHYKQIAGDWLNNRLPANVTEQMLRELYSLTKAQLNEVLVCASQDGWAERKQGYGWRFMPAAERAATFEKIYSFRMLIEPAAMLQPSFVLDSQVLNEQRLIQLRTLNAGVERLSVERLLREDASFHQEITRMSENPYFLTSLTSVNRMRRILNDHTQVNRSIVVEQCERHLEIIDHLAKGEIATASLVMIHHLGEEHRREMQVV